MQVENACPPSESSPDHARPYTEGLPGEPIFKTNDGPANERAVCATFGTAHSL
jgi:hypothetical protein